MTTPQSPWSPSAPEPAEEQRSISLHIERLVVDGSLLAAGGERELRHAFAEALERMLPGAISDATGRRSPASLADTTSVAAGRPSALAAGVAGRVARHVGLAVGSAVDHPTRSSGSLPARYPRQP